MPKGLIYSLIFVSGAAAGILSTKHFFKKYYEQLADEEIESVRNVYAPKEKESNKDAQKKPQGVKNEKTEFRDKSTIDEMNKLTSKYNYSERYQTRPDKSQEDITSDSDTVDDSDTIRVISPDEFGEIESYEKITLFYFADKILTDENEQPVEDVIFTVGPYALTSFGQYEDDAVHVVNDNLRSYYEILRDLRKFDDIPRRNK